MSTPEIGSGHAEWQPDLLLPEEFVFFDTLSGEVSTPICDVFTMPEVAESLFNSKERFWFKPEFIQRFEPTTNYLLGCSFEEKPEWRETRRNSRRQAFFGELKLDFGSEQTTIPVACKHFYGAPEEGLHEYLASEYINQLNFIKAFEPIGLWFDPNGTAFLLTHFEEDVISFDNVDWQRNPDNSIREHFDILAALERAAYSGARYAAHDIAHRDYLAKNAGFDQKNQEVRAIDLEQLRIIQSPEEPNLGLMFDAMLGDQMAFIASIHAAGFRWGDDPELRSQVIRSTYLSNYRSTLRHPSTLCHRNYGNEFIEMVEDLCSYLESQSDEDLENYWNQLLAEEEGRQNQEI